MPVEELNVLFTSTTDQSRKTLEDLLRKHHGTLVTSIGNACLSIFEDKTEALSAAQAMKQAHSESRIALTRGMVTLSANNAFGEPVNLAAQLEGMAQPGDILASEPYVQNLDPSPPRFHVIAVRQFKGIQGTVKVFGWDSAGKAPGKKDPKEFFDFSRVEQERAQEAKVLRRPDPSAREGPIPFAVEPEAAKEVRREPMIPSLREMKKEQTARNLKNVLLISLVFIVLLPGIFFGFWWLVGSSQKSAIRSEKEIQQGVENSDVLRAIKADRPKGISPADIARGNVPVFGTLTIETSPSQAEVYVQDQRVKALTPVRLKNVEAKTPVQVVIKKAGYKPFVQLINLAPNEEKKLSIKLAKLQ